MEFTVYRKFDGYPANLDDFVDTTKETCFSSMDLCEFLITESGKLILSDDRGNYMPVLKEGKYIIDICLEKQGTIVKVNY